ncbi:MAG: sugar ABC transporter substrate-binding protein [Ardenticatenaceae bacterium]|nr:sugar ABC transporter substrate-binding protein [Ardenticatenaceae bacterium]
MKLQKLILFLVVSGIVLAMTACGAAEPETKTLTFSPLALSIPALKGLSEGVKAVGGEMGYDVIVVDPDFDPTKQAQQLNELITTGRTSAAWVISVNPGAMKDVVDQAQAKEVVLVLNGVPEDYGYSGMQAGVTFARINYEKFGGTVGELLGQCVNEKLGGSAKVIFLQSAEGTAGKQEIEESMQGKLSELAPGAEIVATAIISERAEGQNTVGQILQANPDANAVMTTNDEGGLGALGAFKAAGTELPCLVDAGGNDEVLAAVESGEMYGAAALDFQGDMMQTFEAVATMLADPSAPGAQLEVPVIPHKTGE